MKESFQNIVLTACSKPREGNRKKHKNGVSICFSLQQLNVTKQSLAKPLGKKQNLVFSCVTDDHGLAKLS